MILKPLPFILGLSNCDAVEVVFRRVVCMLNLFYLVTMQPCRPAIIVKKSNRIADTDVCPNAPVVIAVAVIVGVALPCLHLLFEWS